MNITVKHQNQSNKLQFRLYKQLQSSSILFLFLLLIFSSWLFSFLFFLALPARQCVSFYSARAHNDKTIT